MLCQFSPGVARLGQVISGNFRLFQVSSGWVSLSQFREG
jgi:hypothetical protein